MTPTEQVEALRVALATFREEYLPSGLIDTQEWQAVDAALAALTAAGQGWQDISTAPKNGYIIGAWQDGSRWRAAQIFSEYGDSWVDVFSDRIHQPTHWIAPPSTEEVT